MSHETTGSKTAIDGFIDFTAGSIELKEDQLLQGFKNLSLKVADGIAGVSAALAVSPDATHNFVRGRQSTGIWWAYLSSTFLSLCFLPLFLQVNLALLQKMLPKNFAAAKNLWIIKVDYSLMNASLSYAGSGIALVYVGQPLDTIKVKLQTFPHLYKNMFQCLEQTVAKEGFFRGLYAGTVPAIIANVAENSVLFAAYGGFTEPLCVRKCFCWMFSCFFSSFTLCPTELIKCKLQAAREVQLTKGESMLRLSPLKITQQVVREEGFRGLFRGLDSTIAREMPGYFALFGGYELTRQLLTPEYSTPDAIGVAGTMIAGAVGGMAFWLFIFPADVVKSRLQVSNLSGNLFQLIFRIGKAEGIMALYSGLGPTIIRTIPSTAVLFATIESSKEILHSWLDPPEQNNQKVYHFQSD